MRLMIEANMRKRASSSLTDSASNRSTSIESYDYKEDDGDHGKHVSFLQVFLSFTMFALVVSEMLTLWDPPPEIDDPGRGRRELLPDGTHAFVAKLSESLPEAPFADHSVTPDIVWLMSFPSSGTSFTLHMTRTTANSTTATNYGKESGFKDKPSVQAIKGKAGANGPFLQLLPDIHTDVPQQIITKTHCAAFCTFECNNVNDFFTPRAFQMGCLSGERLEYVDGDLKTTNVRYSPSLVKKAIHIFRDPLDNVVAGFHKVYHRAEKQNDEEFLKLFSNTQEGFQAWCERDNKNYRHLLNSPQVDPAMRRALEKIPCFNAFYRYVQWHNLAFDVTHDLNIPTLLFHYGQYEENFPAARATILSFLDLSQVSEAEKFIPGKTYRHYYSAAQKSKIRAFLEEFATVETWEQLKTYTFE